MRTILATFMLALMLGIALAYAQNAALYKAQAGLPEVVNIKATMLDSARVCLDPPDGGIASCVTVGELRKWVRDRQAK